MFYFIYYLIQEDIIVYVSFPWKRTDTELIQQFLILNAVHTPAASTGNAEQTMMLTSWTKMIMSNLVFIHVVFAVCCLVNITLEEWNSVVFVVLSKKEWIDPNYCYCLLRELEICIFFHSERLSIMIMKRGWQSLLKYSIRNHSKHIYRLHLSLWLNWFADSWNSN